MRVYNTIQSNLTKGYDCGSSQHLHRVRDSITHISLISINCDDYIWFPDTVLSEQEIYIVVVSNLTLIWTLEVSYIYEAINTYSDDYNVR